MVNFNSQELRVSRYSYLSLFSKDQIKYIFLDFLEFVVLPIIYFFYIFSGSGGCDLSGNKRTAEESFDQKLTKSNAAIALSCNAEFNDKKGNESTNWQNGKPVRVHRSYKFQKYSKYAPEDGVRCVICYIFKLFFDDLHIFTY
jgi:hypothetical protein